MAESGANSPRASEVAPAPSYRSSGANATLTTSDRQCATPGVAESRYLMKKARRNTRLILWDLTCRLEEAFGVLAAILAVEPETPFQSNENIDRARRLHGGR